MFDTRDCFGLRRKEALQCQAYNFFGPNQPRPNLFFDRATSIEIFNDRNSLLIATEDIHFTHPTSTFLWH